MTYPAFARRLALTIPVLRRLHDRMQQMSAEISHLESDRSRLQAENLRLQERFDRLAEHRDEIARSAQALRGQIAALKPTAEMTGVVQSLRDELEDISIALYASRLDIERMVRRAGLVKTDTKNAGVR